VIDDDAVEESTRAGDVERRNSQIVDWPLGR
jgi:hypothetical protein